MGRAKLEMKYRENTRARRATYMTRMQGLKKKAAELSILCGVDVLIASLSPEVNAVQFWPEQDTVEFRRIRELYIHFRRSRKSDGCSDEENNPFQPMPSPSFPSIPEEMADMNIKLREVRERLCFLEAASSDAANEEQTVLQPLQVVISSQLEEEQTLQVRGMFPPSLPSLDQPSPSGQALISHSDFTLEGPPIFLALPSNSALLRFMDDCNWCDSLVDYDKW